MQKKRRNYSGLIILVAAVALIWWVAGELKAPADGAAAPQAAAAGAGMAPPVDVQEIQPQQRRLWNEFSGRLQAIDEVEIRPRVSGIITQVLFDEGAIVKAGDPLFVIDPRPFEAAVATAEAALQAAKSQTQLTQLEYERARKLVKGGSIADTVRDQRQRDYQVAQSAVKGAEAQLKQARLDLEYAHIKAPISGRISRAEITVGNVVQAGSSAPVLTTIVSNGELYGEFDVDEQTYLSTVRNSDEEAMPVEMTLPGDKGKDITYRGNIHSFDNQLNTGSGTIRARAIFKNTDGALMPGMYADFHLGTASKEALLMVDDKAIGTDQNKKFVYVVTPDNKVAYREVVLGQAVEGSHVVLSGLEAGDKVMVNSLQKVRPGMPVKPVVVMNKQDVHGVIVSEAEKGNNDDKKPQ